MIHRAHDQKRIHQLLTQFPVVGIIGARQVGKTTLARRITEGQDHVEFFDCEYPADQARLADPQLALEPLRGLVVLDEIQFLPDLFPLLRVLADRPGTPARFLVLGSASPALLRQGSETLAGRIAWHELGPICLADVGIDAMEQLWLRGGFPRSFLGNSDATSAEWRQAFVNTFLTRDLPQLGIHIPSPTMRRFWTMLAHYHGQTWNGSEIARAFGISDKTVRRYLDLLTQAFVVRQIQPWFANISKRQVKAPRVYLADSGLLHTLLDLESMRSLQAHPKIGASWEGFCMEQVVRMLRVRWDQCYYWRTHQGAELDLLVTTAGRRLGFEFKRTAAPKLTRSMHIAQTDLELDELTVVHAGAKSFDLSVGVRALAANQLGDGLLQ